MTARAAVRPLLIAETFGPTVQGEGPSCGQQALFMRLSRCNLSCPDCDTPYTWDWSRFDIHAETTKRTGGELVAWALGSPAELVVITGGEPLIQQDLLEPVVAALTAAGRRVEIETNGTFAPTAALAETVTAFNVSPKLASFAAPADQDKRINPGVLAALQATGRARFKFVASSPADLDEISDLQQRFGLRPVWVMPEGTTPDRVLTGMRNLADEVIARGWNMSTRLHVLVWGDIRGR